MIDSLSTLERCGSPKAGLTAKRRAFGRRTGTTLIEILVVIVIFLIGILAVVQVFPRGFRLLLTTENNSKATALGRDEVERLKSSPELIPDEIVPVRYSGGQAEIDTTLNPLALGPLGDTISGAGGLSNGGSVVNKDWMLAAGPNVARRIIGEGQRIPAPRQVGPIPSGAANRFESYGGLMVLNHGPIDPGPNPTTSPNIVAYANDLSRTVGAPRESTPLTPNSAITLSTSYVDGTGNVVTNSFTGVKTISPVSVAPFEFFVVNAGLPTASILVPANHASSRTYRVRMSAYVGNATFKRYDYLSLNVTVPVVPEAGVNLVQVPLAPLIANTNEMASPNSMAAIEPESVRVAPQYRIVSTWSTPNSTGTTSLFPGVDVNAPIDPFEVKVTDPNLGVLLFSPAGRDGVVSRPGGVSEPLLARVDYDVRDWRIISEDFRVTDGGASYSTGLQNLKVGANIAPDGLFNGGLFSVIRSGSTDGNSYDPVPTPRDNVVVVDLTTGFEVQRYRTDTKDGNGRTMADVPGTANTSLADILVSVDKPRGSLTFRDAQSGGGAVDVRLIPPIGAPIVVDATNRTFRVLYRARQEWAVQVLKGASQYTIVNSLPNQLAPDQAYVGGTASGFLPTRIYFPTSEAGHKVTIDRIAYRWSDGTEHLLEGQDFVLRPPSGNSFAYADLKEADGSAATFSNVYGTPVRGIKGASVSVRVLWNPESFSLTSNAATNRQRVDEWGRAWRKSLTETYLRAEETR